MCWINKRNRRVVRCINQYKRCVVHKVDCEKRTWPSRGLRTGYTNRLWPSYTPTPYQQFTEQSNYYNLYIQYFILSDKVEITITVQRKRVHPLIRHMLPYPHVINNQIIKSSNHQIIKSSNHQQRYYHLIHNSS